MVSVPSTPGDPDLLMSIVLPYFLGLCFLVQTASQFLRSKNRLHWASLVLVTIRLVKNKKVFKNSKCGQECGKMEVLISGLG